MPNIAENVFNWLDQGELPEEKIFFSVMQDEDGVFHSEEGQYWDFKKEWPFSLSDDYFAGIARSICGFSNTSGGILVFGVHDLHRTGGHNRVSINFDKFQLALSQCLNSQPILSIQRFTDENKQDVHVLFVQPRRSTTQPLRVIKSVGKYPIDTIWVRAGHQFIAATPTHFPTIFCRAAIAGTGAETSELDGSLPPSPATVKRFVGRVNVLDRLFSWLQLSDEPRTYLHGKGGSGKSTIAFEFARLVKDYGSNITGLNNTAFDSVIYLTAKERELVTSSSPMIGETVPDFSTEDELYRKILFYGRWIISEEELEKLSTDELKLELKELFNYKSMLIVLDDIDTLTTKGVDPGSDFLYRTLCRAERNSKLLYTIRNAPTQSLANSIEVPGLNEAEYKQFIIECVQQFNVKPPEEEFSSNRLLDLSERRPLVIESIIALVRSTGSYDRAADAFVQHAGQNVRDYVFLREWDALPTAAPAKLLLAALCDLDQSATFSQIETLLRNEESRVRDAIGATREMFLVVDHTGVEALFSLSPLTKQFIASKKNVLVGYTALKERVRAYKRNVSITSPAIAAQIIRIERILPPRQAEHDKSKAQQAWTALDQFSSNPKMTEDPVFKALLGYVASACTPPKFSDARSNFKYAFDMAYEPDFRYLVAWFNAERKSGSFDGYCEKIAEYVISGKKYSRRDKIEMTSRKGAHLYARGRDIQFTEPNEAMKCFAQAIALHLKAFRSNCLDANPYADHCERYAMVSAHSLFIMRSRSLSPWQLIDDFIDISKETELYLDPIEGPFLQSLNSTLKNPTKNETLHRMRQRLRTLSGTTRADRWMSSETERKFDTALIAIDDTIQQLIRRRPSDK